MNNKFETYELYSWVSFFCLKGKEMKDYCTPDWLLTPPVFKPKPVDLKCEKRSAKKTAKDLGYDKGVIDAIDNAKSVYQIDNIMAQARKDMHD